MTQDEIDEIAKNLSDEMHIEGGGSMLSLRSVCVKFARRLVAEIQRTQEPVASCYVSTFGHMDFNFAEEAGELLQKGTKYKLFTFPPAPVVPEGWQLVPKTLSLEMYATFMKAYCEGEELRECLKQAIAAAPEYK